MAIPSFLSSALSPLTSPIKSSSPPTANPTSHAMASLLLLLAVVLTAISATAVSATKNSTGFISRSCAVTLYPNLCYTSLKPYAAIVKQNPLTLAVTAADVSLVKIKDAALQATVLRRGSTGRASAALRDCVDLLRTAAHITKQSAAEIQKLGPAAQSGGSSFSWEASNAQTWMSAALTNEDTCIDGFHDVRGGGGSSVKRFLAKVGRVEKYTSNALALLNALVDG